MANRLFYHPWTQGNNHVHLRFAWSPNNTSTPTLGEGAASYVTSVARTGVGAFTLTLADKYPAIVNAHATLKTAAAQDTAVVLGSIDVVSARTVALTFKGFTRTGTAVLSSGTKTVSDTTVAASTIITLTRAAQGGTVTNTVQYEAPTASIVAGTSFVINACVAAGTVNAADTSTIAYNMYTPTGFAVDLPSTTTVYMDIVLRNGGVTP